MSRSPSRIVCIGEGMVELSSRQGGGWSVHYGGDVLNVALHLARLGQDTALMTALGGDPFAGQIRSAWGREGLDVSLVHTVPERNTGLYAIVTDDNGERRFTYWRGESAARRMFHAPMIDRVLDQVRGAGVLFFSLITLAILPDEDRDALLLLVREVKARGGRFAFDGNYRPALWQSSKEARHWRDRAAVLADFGFPSLDDESALGPAEEAEAIRGHWTELGCGEVLLKRGAEGCILPDGTAVASTRLPALDTSGAGDAFDAAYLDARLDGASPADAAAAGQRLAGWVVMRAGAIPPRDHAAPYGFTASNSPE